MRFSKRSLEGSLLIDHSACPGTPRVPGGTRFESATITCSHCHRVVILNPDRSRERAYCQKCDHYICDQCAATGECRPMNKVLDDLQNAIERGEPIAT